MSKTTMEDVRRVAEKYGVNPEFASYIKEGDQLMGATAVMTREELDKLEDPEGFEKELLTLGMLIAIPGTDTFAALSVPGFGLPLLDPRLDFYFVVSGHIPQEHDLWLFLTHHCSMVW